MGVVLVLTVLGVFIAECLGAFYSEQSKANKRWNACINGKVPFSQMLWFEKILTPYRKYLKSNLRGEYLLSEISDALVLCQKDLYTAYINDEMGNEPYLYNSGFMREAVSIGLKEAYKKWHGDFLAFVSHYVHAIVVAEQVALMADRGEQQNGLQTKIAIFEMCIDLMKDNWLKKDCLEKKAKAKKELQRRAESEKLRIHRERIESQGHFSEVKTGEDYELFVIFCVKDAGFECEKVGKTGDYGADIIVVVDDKRLVIQCKYYTSTVGYDAIQQAFAAKAIYNCDWCCVVSNSAYTHQAIDGGKKLKVKLLSHTNLAHYLNELKKGKVRQNAYEQHHQMRLF